MISWWGILGPQLFMRWQYTQCNDKTCDVLNKQIMKASKINICEWMAIVAKKDISIISIINAKLWLLLQSHCQLSFFTTQYFNHYD